jgi:hypothetical protein
MTSARALHRYRAASMELAAHLDDHYVEIRIVTDTGEAVVVVCPRDSIFAVQRQIERIGHECPEIATWSRDPSTTSRSSPRAMTTR